MAQSQGQLRGPSAADGLGFHPGAGAFSTVSAEAHSFTCVRDTPLNVVKVMRRSTELPCRTTGNLHVAGRGPSGLIQARLTVTIL